MDEHLTFNKNAKELAKSASLALGSLMSKVVATVGMTHRVYTKLYTSTVEPILMYGSSIWGTKQFSCISSVQNRACKFFLYVGKHTSNIAARGDMGWTSCFTKQRVNLCRLWCRHLRTDESRNSYKILKWISRSRKGWTSVVEKTVNKLNVRDVIHNTVNSEINAMFLLMLKIRLVGDRNI